MNQETFVKAKGILTEIYSIEDRIADLDEMLNKKAVSIYVKGHDNDEESPVTIEFCIKEEVQDFLESKKKICNERLSLLRQQFEAI